MSQRHTQCNIADKGSTPAQQLAIFIITILIMAGLGGYGTWWHNHGNRGRTIAE